MNFKHDFFKLYRNLKKDGSLRNVGKKARLGFWAPAGGKDPNNTKNKKIESYSDTVKF